jgi:hypothetical protein
MLSYYTVIEPVLPPAQAAVNTATKPVLSEPAETGRTFSPESEPDPEDDFYLVRWAVI